MKTFCTALALGYAAIISAVAAEDLNYESIYTSLNSLSANMVLISGDKKALLVDVPFSRADAHRLVAKILDSGKELETVFITHDHPDHFFGLDVISDAFPNARLVAHKQVAKDMVRSVPIKFERWSPMLGKNAPVRQVLPEGLKGAKLTLEGQDLEIIGPLQGDHVHATAIWDAQSGTLVSGDFLFNGVHVWLGEHLAPNYKAWLKALDTLEALEPKRIIAGHSRPNNVDDSYAIDWTRKYIQTFAQIAKSSSSAAEISEKMTALYPNAVDVADGFILGISSQVASGEIEPWDE